MMHQMQLKLEQIENKLNYFLQNSPKKLGSDRDSLQILDFEESEFLEKARKEIYSKHDKPFDIAKSYKSSMNGTEEKSVASAYGIKARNTFLDRDIVSPINSPENLWSETNINSDCKHEMLKFLDYHNTTRHKNQPSLGRDSSGLSDQHGGMVRLIIFLWFTWVGINLYRNNKF